MKKFIVAILISISFVMSPFSAHAELELQYDASRGLMNNQGVHTFINSYACEYFTHLHDNAAYNKSGSCGYVAIASLLAFYDSFWNDCIIPESYDQVTTSLEVSPGIRNERAVFASMTDEEYLSATYQEQNINTYFQFLLFSLRRQDTSSNTTTFGVNYTKMCEMIDYYLFEYLALSDTVCSVVTTEEDVQDFAVEYIEKGFPVIIGIPGHVTVAYDYDSSTQKMYGYWGYGNEQNHQEYGTLSDAYAIVLDMEHVHSNNYVIDGVEKCTCSLTSHTHDYEYQYGTVFDEYHNNVCYCGASSACQGTLSWVSVNSTHHRISCSCGFATIGSHLFNPRNAYYVGIDQYNTCLGCGAIIKLSSDFGGIIHPNRIDLEVEGII